MPLLNQNYFPYHKRLDACFLCWQENLWFETDFDNYLCFIYVVLNLTTNFNVKPLFVSSLHEGWSISSRMYLPLALPHIWLAVLKHFHTKVHFIRFDQNMVYSRFFSCTSSKPVPQSFMSQGDHLNMCCFPNLCFYALF